MRKRVIGLAVGSMLFALSVSAQAQQPGKIHRIGFLDASTASGSAALVEAFRQEMRKLEWIEGKISALSTDLPSKSVSVSPNLRQTWFVLRLI